MKDRIKQLRKYLKLTQAGFGAKFGLKQGAIADWELGRNVITERNFDAICDVFNVNPEWLRNGIGAMFNPPSETKWLDDLAKRNGLTPDEKALIVSIVELPQEARKAVIDWAYKLVESLESNRAVVLPEDPKEKRRRELEKTIADAQQELAEMNSYSEGKESSSVAG